MAPRLYLRFEIELKDRGEESTTLMKGDQLEITANLLAAL